MSKRTIAVLTLIVAAAGCAGSESADDALDDATAEPAATESSDPADTADTGTPVDDTTPPDTTSDTTPADTTPADEGNAAVTTPPISSSPTGPAPSSPTAMYTAGDIDNGLQPFIEQALDDLATRLDVDASDITTHAAVLVTWPDASLGCPQPGMSYAQAQMDGSVIELEHDGRFFRYHTGGSQSPFLCDTPITKTPPTEGLSISDSADS